MQLHLRELTALLAFTISPALVCFATLAASANTENNLPNTDSSSISKKVSSKFFEPNRDLVAEADRWKNWGYRSYQAGRYSEAEKMLKFSLSSLNSGYSQNLLIPRPAQYKETSINIPFIFSYYENSYEPSELIGSARLSGTSLDEVYTDIVTALSNGSGSISNIYSIFYSKQYEQFRNILRQEVPPEKIQDIQKNISIQKNRTEDAHSIAVKTIRALQQTLIAQNLPNKTEEALEIAELSRSLEFNRLVPAAIYSTLNPELIALNSNYQGLSNANFKHLTAKNIKEIAVREKATIVYYSVISDKEIFLWVIDPTGQISVKKINLKGSKLSLNAILDDAFQVASSCSYSDTDRGRQKKQAIQVCRDVRSENLTTSTQVSVVREEVQREKLQELYRLLIKPIKDLLPSNPDTNVIFVPQESLSGVPFAALQDANGQYLIEQHTIRIVPSLSSLTQYRKPIEKFPSGKDLLIVGNPTMPTLKFTDGTLQQLPNLPGAEAEAIDLGKLMETDPYIGLRADMNIVRQRMSDAKIIHFATHGILYYQNLTDFIVVQQTVGDRRPSFHIESDTTVSSDIRYSLWYGESGGTPWKVVRARLDLPGAIVMNNSLLTARDVLSLPKLNADLVVLSACSTGKGIPTDSTILGLPFSFGLVGVPQVLVSLWKVPDNSTRLLMIEFYNAMREQTYKQRKVDTASALRTAMLKVKSHEIYKDPIHWAAFSLIEVPQSPK